MAKDHPSGTPGTQRRGDIIAVAAASNLDLSAETETQGTFYLLQVTGIAPNPDLTRSGDLIWRRPAVRKDDETTPIKGEQIYKRRERTGDVTQVGKTDNHLVQDNTGRHPTEDDPVEYQDIDGRTIIGEDIIDRQSYSAIYVDLDGLSAAQLRQLNETGVLAITWDELAPYVKTRKDDSLWRRIVL